MCSKGSEGSTTYSVGNFADILDKTATKCPTRMPSEVQAGSGRGEGGTEAKISTVKVQDERVTTCKTSDKRNGSQVEAKRKRKLCMQHNARKKWAKRGRIREGMRGG